MKRYASSKFRIVLLTILLAVGLFVTIAHAADAATGDATTQVVPAGEPVHADLQPLA